MSELILNLDSTVGKIKPMHSVNNGPSKGRSDQTRSNFDTFKDAHIPLARTHDASFCPSYGGEHTVDVHINRLRDRFRDNPDFEIVTVRGLGYKAVKK